MKRLVLSLIALMALISIRANAQEVIPVGPMPTVQDSRPMQFAISGFELITFRASYQGHSPYMRSALCDARLSAIIQRTQEPPLRSSDIRYVKKNGHYLIVLRRYLLTEVEPQDARAAGKSQEALARQWTAACKRAIPQVMPIPSRFGV